jgi:hypothetical protein
MAFSILRKAKSIFALLHFSITYVIGKMSIHPCIKLRVAENLCFQQPAEGRPIITRNIGNIPPELPQARRFHS